MFRLMEKEFTSKDFKKEWNIWEHKGVLAYLQEAFKDIYNIKDINFKFGLPYTSSSSYAMISNTNTFFEIEDGWRLEHFALTNNDILVAVAWDENENEQFYEVDYESE